MSLIIDTRVKDPQSPQCQYAIERTLSKPGASGFFFATPCEFC